MVSGWPGGWDWGHALARGTRLLLIWVKLASLTTLWPHFLLPPLLFSHSPLRRQDLCVGTYCQYIRALSGSLITAYLMASCFVLEQQEGPGNCPREFPALWSRAHCAAVRWLDPCLRVSGRWRCGFHQLALFEGETCWHLPVATAREQLPRCRFTLVFAGWVCSVRGEAGSLGVEVWCLILNSELPFSAVTPLCCACLVVALNRSGVLCHTARILGITNNVGSLIIRSSLPTPNS